MKRAKNATIWYLSPYLSRLGACAVPYLIASAAGAQFVEPPTITTTTVERTVHGDVGADGEDCLHDFDETSSGEDGPFAWPASVQCTGMYGSGGFGTAQQNTQISSYSISGTGSVLADATVGNDPNAWVTLNVWSQLSVQFTVPVDTIMQLGGSFEITVGQDPDGTCGEDTGGWVFFTGTDTNGAPILFNQTFDCEDPPGQASFNHPDTLKANTPAHLFIWVASGVMGVVGGESPDLGQRSASFDFNFDLGDRDGDGLLNIWEEQEGINVDADPDLEIDLSGANPDRKDIFVEVDIMAGTTYDAAAIQDVKDAFASAPASLVRNPTSGHSEVIKLHVINGGHTPANQILTDSCTPDDCLPLEFDSIKQANFGLPSDSPAAREARKLVFRYCLWADRVQLGPLLDSTSGGAELPGNDFVVYSGSVRNLFPTVQTDALAGVFMHELGHALGLRHGGQDNMKFKPNYLSVMSYMYQVPLDVPIQNPGLPESNVKWAWKLDYSRKAATTLNEILLIENQPLLGPAGRLIIFNSAPDDAPVRDLNLWFADSPSTNWNNNMDPAESDPYPLDISRIDQRADPGYQLALKSYTDWDRLWYHLSGADNFTANREDSDPSGGTEPSLDPNIGPDTLESILSANWIDQTALVDEIFRNDFESGDTSAWSDTVP